MDGLQAEDVSTDMQTSAWNGMAEAMYKVKLCIVRQCWAHFVRPATQELQALTERYEGLKKQFHVARTAYLHEVSALRDELRIRPDPEELGAGSPDIISFFDPTMSLQPPELKFACEVITEKLKMIFETNPGVQRGCNLTQLQQLLQAKEGNEVAELKAALKSRDEEEKELRRVIAELQKVPSGRGAGDSPLKLTPGADAIIRDLEEQVGILKVRLRECNSIEVLRQERDELQAAYDSEVSDRLSLQRQLEEQRDNFASAEAGAKAGYDIAADGQRETSGTGNEINGRQELCPSTFQHWREAMPACPSNGSHRHFSRGVVRAERAGEALPREAMPLCPILVVRKLCIGRRPAYAVDMALEEELQLAKSEGEELSPASPKVASKGSPPLRQQRRTFVRRETFPLGGVVASRFLALGASDEGGLTTNLQDVSSNVTSRAHGDTALSPEPVRENGSRQRDAVSRPPMDHEVQRTTVPVTTPKDNNDKKRKSFLHPAATDAPDVQEKAPPSPDRRERLLQSEMELLLTGEVCELRRKLRGQWREQARRGAEDALTLLSVSSRVFEEASASRSSLVDIEVELQASSCSPAELRICGSRAQEHLGANLAQSAMLFVANAPHNTRGIGSSCHFSPKPNSYGSPKPDSECEAEAARTSPRTPKPKSLFGCSESRRRDRGLGPCFHEAPVLRQLAVHVPVTCLSSEHWFDAIWSMLGHRHFVVLHANWELREAETRAAIARVNADEVRPDGDEADPSANGAAESERELPRHVQQALRCLSANPELAKGSLDVKLVTLRLGDAEADNFQLVEDLQELKAKASKSAAAIRASPSFPLAEAGLHDTLSGFDGIGENSVYQRLSKFGQQQSKRFAASRQRYVAESTKALMLCLKLAPTSAVQKEPLSTAALGNLDGQSLDADRMEATSDRMQRPLGGDVSGGEGLSNGMAFHGRDDGAALAVAPRDARAPDTRTLRRRPFFPRASTAVTLVRPRRMDSVQELDVIGGSLQCSLISVTRAATPPPPPCNLLGVALSGHSSATPSEGGNDGDDQGHSLQSPGDSCASFRPASLREVSEALNLGPERPSQGGCGGQTVGGWKRLHRKNSEIQTMEMKRLAPPRPFAQRTVSCGKQYSARGCCGTAS
ncbi:unnamed protein product [Polarella glacialis]|uniref:Uncharacterized protein n=1 Tax=Polarella glacialis TaxID=89957 RepID=A0A813IIW5_POLGL|nr:unnamed protein product [Polarella glacialis]